MRFAVIATSNEEFKFYNLNPKESDVYDTLF